MGVQKGVEVKIAVRWSYTKGLTTYDGRKVRVEDKRSFLQRLQKLRKTTEECDPARESKSATRLPTVIIEEGCPASLIYDLVVQGNQVLLISNSAAADYRAKRGIAKNREGDAKIIWRLATYGANLRMPRIDDDWLQLRSLYLKYWNYQKARVKIQNMRTAYLRYFGYEGPGSGSRLSGETPPYDIVLDILKTEEDSAMAKLTRLISASASKSVASRPLVRGLGPRIWAGIAVTANPSDFKCVSSYLRFCGLTGDAFNGKKYSRHANMLYHMLAEGIVRQQDPVFSQLYYEYKADIASRKPDYTKNHVDNAALNRIATMLAKRIFRHVKSTISEAGERI